MKSLIAALAKDGHNRREVAGILKLPYVTCCKRIARYGLQSLFKDAEFRARSIASIEDNKKRRLMMKSSDDDGGVFTLKTGYKEKG